MLRKIKGINKVFVFYVNNGETMQPIKYLKQQHKIYPTQFFIIRQIHFFLIFFRFDSETIIMSAGNTQNSKYCNALPNKSENICNIKKA